MAYLDGVVCTVSPCRSAWMGDILIQKPHDISQQFEYSVVKEVCWQYPQTACLDGGGKIMDGSARKKKLVNVYDLAGHTCSFPLERDSVQRIFSF